MSDLQSPTLPVLPLSSGVVLPGMVVTLALETDEARAAVDAATDGHVLLVPRIDGLYTQVGTVAAIEDAGEVRRGMRAVVVRGLHRARIGVGVPGLGRALVVESERVDEGEPGERARHLAREYTAVIEAVLDHRGARGIAAALKELDDPSQIADTAGYSPDLTLEQKVQVLEIVDVEARLEKVLEWAKETLADLTLKERIRSEVSDGMEKQQREFLLRQQLAAIRKELGEDAESDESAERYRVRAEEPGVPEKVREAILRELDKLDRTPEQSMEHGWIRSWLDTITELPMGRRQRRQRRPGGRAGRARRRPRGPRRREGADRRVPGGAQAPHRARPRGRRGPRVRRHHHAGRASGRGQDLARRVGRPLDGPSLRQGRPRGHP